MKTAVVYARYSSDNQREESIDAQVRGVKEYCFKEGINLVSEYIDAAISGRSTDKREQFLKMITDSEKRLFDIVIVHKYDRFARNAHDQVVYENILRNNGVELISVIEQFGNTPEGVLIKSNIIGINEYFSLNLARETKKGLKENALKAVHNGGKTPLGYDLDKDKKLVINEKEAESVKIMFKLALDGYSSTRIAYTLNNMGRLNKLGKEFRTSSIRDNLMNIKYIGTYYYGLKDGKGKKQTNPIVIENSHEAIIDKDTFYKVQLGFTERKTGPRRRSERTYHLTGFCKCGDCGGVFSGGYRSKNRNGTINYGYECQKRKKHETSCKNTGIRKELLEKYIFDCLKENILTEENIANISRDIEMVLSEKLKTRTEEMNKYDIDIKKLEVKTSKLLDQYLEGIISKELFNEKKKEIDKKELEFKEKLFSLENIEKIKEDSVRNYLLGLKQGLENSSIKQEILNTFVHNILIFKDRIEVTLRRFPKSLNMISLGGDDESRTRVRNY